MIQCAHEDAMTTIKRHFALFAEEMLPGKRVSLVKTGEHVADGLAIEVSLVADCQGADRSGSVEEDELGSAAGAAGAAAEDKEAGLHRSAAQLDRAGSTAAGSVMHDTSAGKTLELGTLSGGQKTIIAVALLLACSRVHKPGMYLLDEIDAALDETNRLRIMKLLRRAFAHTQFLAITHHATGDSNIDHLIALKMDKGHTQVTMS
jgi:Fe-S cluster assembly ATPase SufC